MKIAGGTLSEGDEHFCFEIVIIISQHNTKF